MPEKDIGLDPKFLSTGMVPSEYENFVTEHGRTPTQDPIPLHKLDDHYSKDTSESPVQGSIKYTNLFVPRLIVEKNHIQEAE